MEQNEGSSQQSTADKGVAQQINRSAGDCVTEYRVAGQDSHQNIKDKVTPAATQLQLLRRLSLTSLMAMLVSAVILILLYRLDQLDEHGKIAAQENEITAIHLMHLLGDQLDAFVTDTGGLDAKALQANPGVRTLAAALDTVREHGFLKLKIFNMSGISVFSSTTKEIGLASERPALLGMALKGETKHVLELRDSFIGPAGVLRDLYIAETFIPLTHAGKRIGAIEIHGDATPIIDRIHTKTAQIALIVFGIFTALYATLFFSARRADRALAEWQKIAPGNAREIPESDRAFHHSVTEAMGEIGLGLFIVDADCRIRFMNTVMKEWFGDQTGQICYASLCDLAERCTHCQLEHVIGNNGTVRYTPAASNGRTFDIIATPIQNRDGTISKLEVVRDVTELCKAEQELRIAAKVFDSQEGMFITDAGGVIQRVNCAFTELTGYSAEEAVGQEPSILNSKLHGAEFYQAIWERLRRDGSWKGEIWNRRKNGEVYPEWQTITAVPGADGQVKHYIFAFSDISQHKEAEEKIRILAFYDPLTHLPNRRLLLDRLQQALALSVRNERQGALLFIDLDNFKSINDTQGHAIGDLLLGEAANRLQACIRKGDTTARLGGDEFVVLLEDLDTDEKTAATQAEIVGEKIRTTMEQPYFIKDHEHHSTASIGIALFRGKVRTMEEMLQQADVALYQAKADGGNTVRFFDPAMQAVVTARVTLESDLRRAVTEQGQFLLYYQAQVDSSGRMIGAEALVRWQHPERGLVTPAEFIPLAEKSGLILPLGHWVLTTACRQLAAWATRPEMAHLTVAVNVSARQFHLPTFVEEVLTLVDYFGVNPAKLKLEITESLLLDNVDDIVTKMAALKARGIAFSLDDFGTGYSSLSYLKRLPLYQLKIDQSFVRDVLIDPNDAAIAKTIVALAQSMNLAVIAEGVETEAQRKFLEQNGCHAFQGSLFSEPVPVEEFEQLIAQFA